MMTPVEVEAIANIVANTVTQSYLTPVSLESYLRAYFATPQGQQLFYECLVNAQKRLNTEFIASSDYGTFLSGT